MGKYRRLPIDSSYLICLLLVISLTSFCYLVSTRVIVNTLLDYSVIHFLGVSALESVFSTVTRMRIPNPFKRLKRDYFLKWEWLTFETSCAFDFFGEYRAEYVALRYVALNRLIRYSFSLTFNYITDNLDTRGETRKTDG